MFHLANLLEHAINPLICALNGGTLDFSALSTPEEIPLVSYAAFIFRGMLTSDQAIVLPNCPQWWYVQNATVGAFALKIRTPSGSLSSPIPQNSAWQLVRCDGENNISLSPPRIYQRTITSREWLGPDESQVLTEIFRVACVPTDQICDELAIEVSQAVENAALEQRIHNLKRKKEVGGPFKRIASLRAQLLQELDELEDEVFQASGVERVSVIGPVAALLDVPLRYLFKLKPKNRVANRPRGSRQRPVLRRLILNLYISIVERAQGKLTLYGGSGKAKGTLPGVLEILRPYLPEVIPAKLPYETLRDIRKSALEAQRSRPDGWRLIK